MFSIYDHQTHRYLTSGRNSETKQECIEDGLMFLINHDADEETEEMLSNPDLDIPTWHDANNFIKGKTELENNELYLKNFELEVREHEDKLEYFDD